EAEDRARDAGLAKLRERGAVGGCAVHIDRDAGGVAPLFLSETAQRADLRPQIASPHPDGNPALAVVDDTRQGLRPVRTEDDRRVRAPRRPQPLAEGLQAHRNPVRTGLVLPPHHPPPPDTLLSPAAPRAGETAAGLPP